MTEGKSKPGTFGRGTRIRVGHSPDADDAFMFYALAKGKVPSEGFEIEHVIEDIESLNQRAFQAELEVTALSCHAYGFLSDRYQLLPYGASVGEGYGPVLVAKSPLTPPSPLRGEGKNNVFFPLPLQGERTKVRGWIRGKKIAVPGRYTTASLVLQIYEKDFIPMFVPFDQIFSAVEKDEVDLGLLIHEGQLTYQELGFQKVLDLGEWWQNEFHLPLPLGINAIRRDLEEETILGFTRLFRKSLEYAETHREEALGYALQFGRGMDAKRGDRFVGMYVNNYSLDLGEKGRAALGLLYELGWKKGFFPERVKLESLVAAL